MKALLLIGVLSLVACNTGNLVQPNTNTVVSQIQVKKSISSSSPIHNSESDNSVNKTSFGLKTVEVTNATSHEISSLVFPNILPADISYDLSRTTCLLKGNQKLESKQNCLLVFRYTPEISGVMTNFVITISGVSNVNDVTEKITSSPIDIEFTSIVTKQQSYNIKKTNVALTDLLLESNSTLNNDNDSITDIRVGEFGLKTLMVKNNTSFNIYSITFPLLPAEFSYDTHTTCKTSAGNKSILFPGEDCLLVLKYIPTRKGDRGTLPIAIVGTNNYYDVITNKVFYLEYSSQK